MRVRSNTKRRYPIRSSDDVRERALFHSLGERNSRMICPMCPQTFQGEGAEKRYKQHWKDKHAKKENQDKKV